MESTDSRQEERLCSAGQGKVAWPDWASWQLANWSASLEWLSSSSSWQTVSSAARARAQQSPYRGLFTARLSSVSLELPSATISWVALLGGLEEQVTNTNSLNSKKQAVLLGCIWSNISQWAGLHGVLLQYTGNGLKLNT